MIPTVPSIIRVKVATADSISWESRGDFRLRDSFGYRDFAVAVFLIVYLVYRRQQVVFIAEPNEAEAT